MAPRRFTTTFATVSQAIVVVVALAALAGCTLKSGPESSASTSPETTAAIDTTTVPTTEVPPSSDTSAPPSSEPLPPDDPDGAFGHTQAELDEFRRIYSEAFRAECNRIWANANGDGSLADPDLGDPYFVGDCIDGLDPDWAEFADSNEEAFQLGVDDAQIAASDLADPLCNDAGRCWSYGF
jgi:hypothetical protein